MEPALSTLAGLLEERKTNDTLRKLRTLDLPADFCSNDYLGLSRLESPAPINSLAHGSGGSRLLTGNSKATEETEARIAAFHKAPSGLIYNSGYDANLGLISCIARRGDSLISDALVHASIIDGARLSQASRYKFEHNNVLDLEKKLQNSSGNKFVLIESVYSMDGDIAPVAEIIDLCQKYQAALIVDEAHALGVVGKAGQGLVQELGLQDQVFARVVTFGKALGCHGAIVLGSGTLRDFLINFSRSFIYTTALPPASIARIDAAYNFLTEERVAELQANIQLYDRLMGLGAITTGTAIRTVRCSSSRAAKEAAASLQAAGFDVRAILSPTVPAGTERLRICIHSFNTPAEISELTRLIKNLHG